MKEHWHPSIKLVDIAEKTKVFVEKNVMNIENESNTFVKWIHHKVV